MDGDSQDQISLSAQMCESLIKMFQDFDGELETLQLIFNGSTGDQLFIDGVPIDQKTVDSVQLFADKKLTVTQIVNAVYTFGVQRDQWKAMLSAWRGLARIE